MLLLGGCGPKKSAPVVDPLDALPVDEVAAMKYTASRLPELLPEVRRRLASPTAARRRILLKALEIDKVRSGYEIAGRLLADKDPWVAATAQEILRAGSGKAPDSVVASLRTPGRVPALWSLAYYDPVPEAFLEVGRSFDARDPDEATAALRLVAVWRLSGFKEQLRAALKAADGGVRKAALRAYVALQPDNASVKAALADFLAYQLSAQQQPKLPLAIRYWRRIDHPLLRQASRRWLEIGDAEVRDATLDYLRTIRYSPPELKALALPTGDRIGENERRWSAAALDIGRATNQSWVISTAAALLGTRNRVPAAALLARTEEGRQILRERLKTSPLSERYAMAVGLAEAGSTDGPVVAALQELERVATTDPNPMICYEVLSDMEGCRSPWARQLFRKELKNANADVRIQAVRGLADEF